MRLCAYRQVIGCRRAAWTQAHADWLHIVLRLAQVAQPCERVLHTMHQKQAASSCQAPGAVGRDSLSRAAVQTSRFHPCPTSRPNQQPRWVHKQIRSTSSPTLREVSTDSLFSVW